MRVTIMGSGTSTGVPSIGCDCPVCTSADPHNKRLRAGVLMEDALPDAEGRRRTILIDCGSDFRQQALTYRIGRLDGVLLTHSHSDHVSGIDDLRIYNFRQSRPIPVYGLPGTLDDIRLRFAYCFDPPQVGGGVASLELIPVEPGAFDFCGLRIVPIPVKHGIVDVVGYRFGDFVYVTDASIIAPASMDLMRGCRILVLNALRHRPHSTHFNLEQAVAVAKEIGAERTWFVHMTHDLDHEATNAALPPNIQLAHDGLQFNILPTETTP